MKLSFNAKCGLINALFLLILLGFNFYFDESMVMKIIISMLFGFCLGCLSEEEWPK